jgi:hypothetical protein
MDESRSKETDGIRQLSFISPESLSKIPTLEISTLRGWISRL